MLTHACKSYFVVCDFLIPLERAKGSELDGEEGSIIAIVLILHIQLIVDIIIVQHVGRRRLLSGACSRRMFLT